MYARSRLINAKQSPIALCGQHSLYLCDTAEEMCADGYDRRLLAKVAGIIEVLQVSAKLFEGVLLAGECSSVCDAVTDHVIVRTD